MNEGKPQLRSRHRPKRNLFNEKQHQINAQLFILFHIADY